jgi:urease accessory protein
MTGRRTVAIAVSERPTIAENAWTPSELLSLVRLLQLASPGLPIGAYSYSQGLEWAVESRAVCDATSARRWIGDLLELVVARGEAAVAWRLINAAQHGDWQAFVSWNGWFRASRETAELRAETLQMGGSLVRLAIELELLDASAREILARLDPVVLPAAFALAARGFGVAGDCALTGYVWSWLENQVLAAVKLVPLGQVAGQRLLASLGAAIPAVVAVATELGDDEISTFAPRFAIASAQHETQYTRLFRS